MNGRDITSIVTRLILGTLYLYMGLSKAVDPVAFLKLIRQYDLVSTPPWINLIAATLPWFEAWCGVLLLAGVAVRGTALLSVAMLVPFTAMVLRRALALHAAAGGAFCAIRFDCGCGAGEVGICGKLIENSLLLALSIFLAGWSTQRFCLRHSLRNPAPSEKE